MVDGASKTVACFYPIKGFRRADGTGITQNRSLGFTDQPLTISCGQCRGCRLERSRQWALRCLHEAQMHSENSFITLTYDKSNLPADGSLVPSHFTKFMYRLRAKLKPKKVRYYHIGEYGDDNNRPHYHALLFGHDFSADRVSRGKTKQGHPIFTSETLADLWGKGRTEIGTVTAQSAGYCARYILKKVTGDLADDHYVNKQTGLYIQPEYSTMSRRPGIGSKWIEKYFSDVYPSDEVIFEGYSTPPPKFYDELLERRDPQLYQRIKSQRRLNGSQHEENNTWDRLEVRETVLAAKTQTLKRKI